MSYIVHRGNMNNFKVLPTLSEEILSKLKSFHYRMSRSGSYYIIYGIMLDGKVMEIVCNASNSKSNLRCREIEALREKAIVEIMFVQGFYFARSETGSLWMLSLEEENAVISLSGNVTTMEPQKIFEDAVSIHRLINKHMILDTKGKLWISKKLDRLKYLPLPGMGNSVITQADSQTGSPLLLSKDGKLYSIIFQEHSDSDAESSTSSAATGSQDELKDFRFYKLRSKHKCKYISCGFFNSAVLTINNQIYILKNEFKSWTLIKSSIPLEKVLFVYFHTFLLDDYDYHSNLWVGIGSQPSLLVWGRSKKDGEIKEPKNSGEISFVDTLVTHGHLEYLSTNLMFEWINRDPVRDRWNEQFGPNRFLRSPFAPTTAEIYHV